MQIPKQVRIWFELFSYSNKVLMMMIESFYRSYGIEPTIYCYYCKSKGLFALLYYNISKTYKYLVLKVHIFLN